MTARIRDRETDVVSVVDAEAVTYDEAKAAIVVPENGLVLAWWVDRETTSS